MIMIMTWKDIVSWGTLPNPTTAVLYKRGRERERERVVGGGGGGGGQGGGDIIYVGKRLLRTEEGISSKRYNIANLHNFDSFITDPRI